jgi:hypothetical protein
LQILALLSSYGDVAGAGAAGGVFVAIAAVSRNIHHPMVQKGQAPS